MRIHCLQHVPFEGPALIQEWAKAREIPFQVTRFFAGEPLPKLDDFDGLVVMGGPMGVYDVEDFPWLKDEIELVAQAIQSGKKVLGVCLGAQLIASALGSRVYPHSAREIGWFDIEKTENTSELFRDLPSPSKVLHWHGDTFDLPEGARNLLRSQVCKHQAFTYGENVLALQFHLEASRATLAEMVKALAGELEESRLQGAHHVQSGSEILEGASEIVQLEPILFRILERFFGN